MINNQDIEWSINKDILRLKMGNGDVVFIEEQALAHLFLNDVLFINSRYWRKDLPDDIKSEVAIFVNCNDIFAWACADSESLPYDEIQKLYEMWEKDPEWGVAIWCIGRRKQMPQKPVEKAIRDAGIWDLDTMGLASNTQDAETQAMFAAAARELKK